jgi:hypothetical protein
MKIESSNVKMIDKLRQEQIDKFPYYVDKWIKIGLSTERIDRKETTENINEFYKQILKLNPVPVFYFSNPVVAYLSIYYIYNLLNTKGSQVWSQVGDQVESQVGSQVRDQVRSQVGSQVWSQVGSQVRDQVRSQVGDQVRSQVGDQVRSQVGDQVRSQVGDQVESQVGSQVGKFVRPYCDGYWAYWNSFYDFFEKECNVKYNDNYKIFTNIANVGPCYPLQEFCCVSEKPITIKMKNGRLHNETGPTVEYEGGLLKVYSLNGIKVPKEIVMTPADQLDPKIILTEKNVEIRREIVRKIGIKRIYLALGAKIIDKQGTYELISLKLEDERIRPFLKMKNPSMEDVWHIEGVHPECKTVEEALKWRNNIDKWEEPITLT